MAIRPGISVSANRDLLAAPVGQLEIGDLEVGELRLVGHSVHIRHSVRIE